MRGGSRCRTIALDRLVLGVAMVMLLAACSEDPAPPVTGAVREFTGAMSLVGTRHRLAHYPTPDPPAIFRVSGTLLLSGPERPNVGFRVEYIGFSNTDSDPGVQGRGVWTDERGDQAFSELLGRVPGPGETVTGRFVGGTGRYSGISGDYAFTWEYLTQAEEGAVAGRVSDLRGRAILAPVPGPSDGKVK